MLNGGKNKMSVKSCEKLEKSKVVLTIEVGAEEFEAAINKAYLKMRGKIAVAGFRPGKAPRKMIEKLYGVEVFYEEAVNIVLPDAYESAVNEQGLQVVGYPEVELVECGKDGVTFKEGALHAAQEAMKLGIDGVECFYPRHSTELTEKLLAFCDENHLSATAGSDCHGAYSTTRVGETDTPVEKVRLRHSALKTLL